LIYKNTFYERVGIVRFLCFDAKNRLIDRLYLTKKQSVRGRFHLCRWSWGLSRVACGFRVAANTSLNWQLGKSIYSQDNLSMLGDWLQVSPDELHVALWRRPSSCRIQGQTYVSVRTLQDRVKHARYVALAVALALALALTLTARVNTRK
jgi:hypothetical protein